MKGLDCSHWQGEIDWTQVNVPFAIIKATEGIAFVDSRFVRNKKEARKNNILVGYYHFADGFNPKKEAQHFLKNVGDIKEGELVALDYEIHLHNPVDWCLTWLKEVEKELGFKPLIYLNKATLRGFDWKPVVKNNNGLWIASYGWNTGLMGIKPPSYDWDFWAIWQYTSRGKVKGIRGNVDMNYTEMNIETLKKYGKPKDDFDCDKLEKEYQEAKKKYKEIKRLRKEKCK